MKEKVIRMMLGVALSIMISVPAFAQADESVKDVTTVTASIKPVIQRKDISRVIATPRGRLISSSELAISEKSPGVVGVYAETLCHVAVKDIYLTIFLERWNNEEETWDTANSYDYEWHAASAEEDLHSSGVTFDIYHLPKGEEYRLRSVHSAAGFDHIFESMAAFTGSITLS